MSTATNQLKRSTWLALFATLAAWWACSYLPDWRLWGLGFMAPLPLFERAIVTLLAVAFSLTVGVASSRLWDQAGRETSGPRLRPLLWAVGAAVCFVLLADRTHFLGDAASRLAALSAERLRGLLEFRLTGILASLFALPFGPDTAGLRAYQVISILSGAVSAWLTAHYAARIFDSGFRALAFVLGLLSAGYMLVFFGYIEGHALLLLAVLGFTLAGTAYARGRAHPVGLFLAFLLAVAVHPLGWSLWPALLFLSLSRGPGGSFWSRTSFGLRALLCVLAAAGTLFLLVTLYNADMAFRLSLVPLFRDRLTVDRYTLFSPAHLLDFANLILLLLPALPLALWFLTRVRRDATDRAGHFLAFTAITTAVTVFCIDPPLGMPRSWDRLALAGVPLAAWMYYRLLTVTSPRAITAALLCAAVSLSVLFCRAWVQVRPEAAVRQAMNYFALDPPRSRTGVHAVGKYLLERNTTAIYGELEDFRRQHYPEEAMRERLNFLFRDKNQLEAAAICQEIIRRDPRYAPAWMFLGFILNNAARFDSAETYLTVADALDPHNPSILNELGRARYYQGDRGGAARLWLESLSEDSLQYVPHLALANYHKDRGEAAEASRRLRLAAARPDAPADTHLELARDHARAGRMSEARAAYEEALAKAVDSAKAALLLGEFPELAPGSPPAAPSQPEPAATPP